MKSLGWLVISIVALGCQKPASNRIQGYVEGEFVYVASPVAGKLETLSVERGNQVESGAALFALEPNPEKANRDEAANRLAQAKSTLDDLRKGRRPSEMESLEAQLLQAQAALVLGEAEFSRQKRLMEGGAGSAEDFDRARALRDQDRQKVIQLEADLKTARLGSRDDQVRAAEADVRAREATLVRTEWDLSQKHQAATQSGLVFDTLYRPGEWVPAGRPVVVVLPPGNVKVRAFVPETRVGAIHLGQELNVRIDGVAEPIAGKVTFISPQAEYAPPVIYSREIREKLVFLIELHFEPAVAAKLHPGQPVDVDMPNAQ